MMTYEKPQEAPPETQQEAPPETQQEAQKKRRESKELEGMTVTAKNTSDQKLLVVNKELGPGESATFDFREYSTWRERQGGKLFDDLLETS